MAIGSPPSSPSHSDHDLIEDDILTFTPRTTIRIDNLIEKAREVLPDYLENDHGAHVIQLAKGLDDAIECVQLMEEELVELKTPTATPLHYKVMRINVVPNIENSSFDTLTKAEWRTFTYPQVKCSVCKEGILTKITSIIELECDHQFHHGCIPKSICKTTGKFICCICDPVMYSSYMQIVADEATAAEREANEQVEEAEQEVLGETDKPDEEEEEEEDEGEKTE